MAPIKLWRKFTILIKESEKRERIVGQRSWSLFRERNDRYNLACNRGKMWRRSLSIFPSRQNVWVRTNFCPSKKHTQWLYCLENNEDSWKDSSKPKLYSETILTKSIWRGISHLTLRFRTKDQFWSS